MTDTNALFVKWLTHDLATPIATIMTASELLGEPADPEINGLVQDGAARLGARLKLIRLAFAPGAGAISATALHKLIADGVEGTPLVWGHGLTEFDGPTAAMIAGATLLLADLARGQPLTVTDTAVHWAAPNALPAAIAASLGGTLPVDSRSAVAAMVAGAAKAAGRVVTATVDGVAWSA
jgi:signal transduction histidine kinase